ncbi:MAG TPA: hypothetical protein VMF90_02165, partial [Rhizobiaceae bacterium]|nr:hypothetical protein [Rhizobiaceae bacterium]
PGATTVVADACGTANSVATKKAEMIVVFMRRRLPKLFPGKLGKAPGIVESVVARHARMVAKWFHSATGRNPGRKACAPPALQWL